MKSAALLLLFCAAPCAADTRPYSAEEYKQLTEGVLAVPVLSRAAILTAVRLRKAKRPSAAGAAA